MSDSNGFSFPFPCKVISITSNATATASQALPGAGNTVAFYNEGTGAGFVAIGAGAQVATLPASTAGAATFTSNPVPPGFSTMTIPADQIYNISTIVRTGTPIINVAVGQGS